MSFAFLLVLAACATEPGSTPGAPAATPPPTAPPTATAPDPKDAPAVGADGAHVEYTWLGAVKGVNFLGEWTSACPKHGYARNLRILPAGRWYGTDITTPCEPGKQCLWNGLVLLSGTWAKHEDKLVLRVINQAPMMFVSTDAGELVEEDVGCTFTKGVTVPPGYTKEQVQAEVLSEPEAASAPTTP
jgi:hypothetical protein